MALARDLIVAQSSKISPLQLILLLRPDLEDQITRDLDVIRGTVRRWANGKYQPSKNQALALVKSLRSVSLVLDGSKYQLDFAGCYDTCIHVDVKFCYSSGVE